MCRNRHLNCGLHPALTIGAQRLLTATPCTPKLPSTFLPAKAGQTIPESHPNPIVVGRVELQLLTTLKCNLKCSYCSLGVGDVLGSQVHVEYDIEQLVAFVDKHLQGKEVYVTFYGGEPTLNKPLMLEVMQRFPKFRFQLQTNATLIDHLPEWALNRLSNVLASIDGGQATTDGYRGNGIYRQVIKNLTEVREHIGGSITARVTRATPTPVLKSWTNWCLRARRLTTCTGSLSPTKCTRATRWTSAKRCWCN